MKVAWISAVALVLASCSTPVQKPREKNSTPSGAMSMSGTEARGEKRVLVEKGVRKSKAKPAARVAGISAISLTTAIETALKKLPGGEALAAEIEVEDGKPLMEVKVFSDGAVYEVEVDASTGDVLEVEQEDDEDDDEDEDEEDEDGNEDDD